MPPAYEVLLLNTAIPQIQAAQSGDTYVVPRDIAFSAALTLSAGTANGVPYLNGSKVVTTGSALTFDGSRFSVIGSGTLEVAQFGTSTDNTPSIGIYSNGSVRAKLRASSAETALLTQGNLPLLFGVNDIERARITSGGDLQIANGNLVMSTSGKGIDFSATSSGTGTMTSELLNDYEEGTWTPVLKFGTNTQSIAANAATYVKIGRAVTINMNLNWAAKSGSGRVYITGLPFAKENNATVGLLASCSAGSITTTAALFYNIDANGTDLNLAEQSGDVDSASLASSGQISCTGTYFV